MDDVLSQLLRAIIRKKIYPQHASRASSVKKYIEDRPAMNAEEDDEKKGKICDDGSKWDRTDSECELIPFLHNLIDACVLHFVLQNRHSLSSC